VPLDYRRNDGHGRPRHQHPDRHEGTRANTDESRNDGERIGDSVNVLTWEDKQARCSLQSGVEKGNHNIIALPDHRVAGWVRHLAIFSMIVVRRRANGIAESDWGLPTAAGSRSSWGTACCSASLATSLARLEGHNSVINQIEHESVGLTGQGDLPSASLYFDRSQRHQRATSDLINIGAVAIAVLFSVLPRWRRLLTGAGACDRVNT